MHRGETNGWSQRDCGLRRIAARNEWQETDPIPEMCHSMIWIATGHGWMKIGKWQEMDLRRWITEDGWQSISFHCSKILRLCEVIGFSRSWLWMWTRNFQSNTDMHGSDVLAVASLHRAPFSAVIRNPKLHSYIPELQCWIQCWIRSLVP